MKKNNWQTIKCQILRSLKTGFVATILLSLFKGDCCSLSDLKFNSNKVITKQNISLPDFDKMALIERNILLMYDNQVLWV